MFFRIWFLFLCKVAALGGILMMTGDIFLRSEQVGVAVGLAGRLIVIPLAITGALLALAIFTFKMRLACPLCGKRGEFVLRARQPGIKCENCGLVACKSVLLSFKLIIYDNFEDKVEHENDLSEAP